MLVYVPQKCKIDKVPLPVVDNTHYDTNESIAAKAIGNYERLKGYVELVLKAQEKCE